VVCFDEVSGVSFDQKDGVNIMKGYMETLAEQAIERGAKSLLLPVACRRQLFELSDEMATKLDIEFYQDGRDALLKALAD
jgi:predicted ATP-dependent Lon-type protease